VSSSSCLSSLGPFDEIEPSFWIDLGQEPPEEATPRGRGHGVPAVARVCRKPADPTPGGALVAAHD
jgi:hypothetical protein